MNKMTCPVCGETEIFEAQESRNLEDGAERLHYVSHSSVCRACGFDFVTDAQSKTNKRNLIAARGAATGVPSGPTLKKWRKKWHFTQKVAGEFLGVGPVAFCKYESNDLLPSSPTTRLLYLVTHSDDAVRLLASRFGVEITPEADIDDNVVAHEKTQDGPAEYQELLLVSGARESTRSVHACWTNEDIGGARRTHEIALETGGL
ncbi:type II TA system antitoxin MqsA family protein (plasmid) [Cupriavidus basilensis]